MDKLLTRIAAVVFGTIAGLLAGVVFIVVCVFIMSLLWGEEAHGAEPLQDHTPFEGYADHMRWHNEFRRRPPNVDRGVVVEVPNNDGGRSSKAAQYPRGCIGVDFKTCMRIWDEQDASLGIGDNDE